ncbi:MAG: DUF2806 domain-containing protein [Cytophagaceae bacterium]|nr:MAG: DUF2806 domain-containing protein [Cytophagaceae bacterium]
MFLPDFDCHVHIVSLGEDAFRPFQVNVEDIIGRAAEHLAASSVDKEPDDIDVDWWNVFETEAVSKSSDDMKEIFSNILAGEISKPGSFSIKAIRTISALDKSVASSFNQLCSLALKSPHISKVLTLEKDASGNGLIEYGLSFEVLSQLQEYGLIHVDYNAYMDYAGLINFADAIIYQNRPAVMVRLDGVEALTEFKLNGVTLSKVGRELYDIARITPSDKYSNSLSAFLRSKGHDLVFYDNQVVSPIVSTTPPTA